MNKKSQLLTLLVIVSVFVLIAGLYYYDKSTDEINYIGNMNTKQLYNLSSTDASCDFEKIHIKKSDIKMFSSIEDARMESFSLNNSLCP